MTYRLSPSARADLEGILRYTLRTWGESQLVRYEQDFLAAFRRISSDPLASGSRTYEYLPPQYRALLVGSHIIVYRRQKDATYIVRILHQRMNLPLHLLNE